MVGNKSQIHRLLAEDANLITVGLSVVYFKILVLFRVIQLRLGFTIDGTLTFIFIFIV